MQGGPKELGPRLTSDFPSIIPTFLQHGAPSTQSIQGHQLRQSLQSGQAHQNPLVRRCVVALLTTQGEKLTHVRSALRIHLLALKTANPRPGCIYCNGFLQDHSYKISNRSTEKTQWCPSRAWSSKANANSLPPCQPTGGWTNHEGQGINCSLGGGRSRIQTRDEVSKKAGSGILCRSPQCGLNRCQSDPISRPMRRR